MTPAFYVFVVGGVIMALFCAGLLLALVMGYTKL